MYYPVVLSIPVTVLIDATNQLTRLKDNGMVLPECRLTGYQYNEHSEMWVLYFGGITVNVHLPYNG